MSGAAWADGLWQRPRNLGERETSKSAAGAAAAGRLCSGPKHGAPRAAGSASAFGAVGSGQRAVKSDAARSLVAVGLFVSDEGICVGVVL